MAFLVSYWSFFFSSWFSQKLPCKYICVFTLLYMAHVYSAEITPHVTGLPYKWVFTLAVSLSHFCWLLRFRLASCDWSPRGWCISRHALHVDVLVWGVNGFKKKKSPCLRLCMLLGPREQYSHHRRTDCVAAALLKDGTPDTLLPPRHTHKLTLALFPFVPLLFFFWFFFCFFCWTKLFRLSCGIQDEKQRRCSLDVGGRDIKRPLLSGALACDLRNSSLNYNHK